MADSAVRLLSYAFFAIALVFASVAWLLGTSPAADAFWIAFTVPNVFRRFVADEGLARRPHGKTHLMRVVAEFADDGRCHVRPVRAKAVGRIY